MPSRSSTPSTSPRREGVRAVESDEVGPGDGVAAREALAVLLEQDHRLRATRAYRLDEPPAHRELPREGRRYGGERRGDQDRVVRGMHGEPFGAVARDDLDVRDAVAGGGPTMGVGAIRAAVSGPHKTGEG